MLYIYTNFHEEILNGFRDMERTQSLYEITIRKIQRGVILLKVKVGLWSFFSAHRLMVLYNYTNFHEEILNGFRDMERTRSLYEITI